MKYFIYFIQYCSLLKPDGFYSRLENIEGLPQRESLCSSDICDFTAPEICCSFIIQCEADGELRNDRNAGYSSVSCRSVTFTDSLIFLRGYSVPTTALLESSV